MFDYPVCRVAGTRLCDYIHVAIHSPGGSCLSIPLGRPHGRGLSSAVREFANSSKGFVQGRGREQSSTLSEDSVVPNFTYHAQGEAPATFLPRLLKGNCRHEGQPINEGMLKEGGLLGGDYLPDLEGSCKDRQVPSQ